MPVEQTPVADLVAACRLGDRQAFQALFNLYRDKVYSIALHYTADAATAADIAHDVFVKLYGAIASFRGESRFDTWLTRLAINRCLDEKRRSGRLVCFDESVPAGTRAGGEGPHEAAARLLRNHQIRAAVALLDPELRAAVVLRYTEGLSYGEMAEVLECPAGTVASRLHRAHRELAARLEHLKGDSYDV